MSYKKTLQVISDLNHKIHTQTLTAQETRQLVLERELTWSSFLHS